MTGFQAKTSFTGLAVTASLVALAGVAEQSPPHECEGYRLCASHQENEDEPVPRVPAMTGSIASSGGGAGSIVSPPPGNITVQGYAGHVDQSDDA